MKVYIIAYGATPWQNGQLIYAEAKRQGLDVSLGFLEWPFKHLLRDIKEDNPDWIFLTGSRALPPEKLDNLAKIAKLAIWDADSLNKERIQIWQNLKGIPSIIFSVIPSLDQTLADKVIWLPQYYDDVYYAPTIPKSTHTLYDIVFLGGLDERRKEWFIKLQSRYKFYQSSNVFGNEMANTYRRSKIAFELFHEGFDTGDYVTSDRIYKAMGSGCFYIFPVINDTKTLFKPGVHFDIYDGTYEMLTDQIDYYLDNEKLRKTITDKGRAEVLEHHTLKVRIKQYWKYMENFK